MLNKYECDNQMSIFDFLGKPITEEPICEVDSWKGECKKLSLENITEYQQWSYVRKNDKYKMKAEIGVVGNCVLVKKWYLYRFAYYFTTEKEKQNLIQSNKTDIEKELKGYDLEFEYYRPLNSIDIKEILYYSKTAKAYSELEYTERNR